MILNIMTLMPMVQHIATLRIITLSIIFIFTDRQTFTGVLSHRVIVATKLNIMTPSITTFNI
jgi:hypothetical protein